MICHLITFGILNSSWHTTGKDIIDPMLARISTMSNIELKMNTKFENFILDKDSVKEKVIGIRVSHDGVNQDILCSKGVILASGGFSADIPFRSVSIPESSLADTQPIPIALIFYLILTLYTFLEDTSPNI